MAGVDLNLRSAGGGGSTAIQSNTGDPVARALQGAGGTLRNIGVSNIAANRREEAALAKANEELEAERQKTFDSSSDAVNRNRVTAANDAIEATVVGNPGNHQLWADSHKNTWDEVSKQFEASSDGLSPEAKLKQSQFIDSRRIAARGALNIQIVGSEVKASNDNWRLNAKLSADEGDREAFDSAIDQVKWTSDAQRDEFKLNTWRAGRYNEINNEMLALNSPDKLSEFAKEIEAMGQEDLNKSQRNQLAVVAKQRAIKMQDGYNVTMRSYNSSLKRGDEIDPARLTDDIAANRISPEMVELVQLQIDEMAEKETYKSDYDQDINSITYIRARSNIIDKYLDPDESPENVELDSKTFKKMIAEIDGLELGEWAKGEIYALAFAAKTEALRQPDHGWRFGFAAVGTGVIPSFGKEEDVTPEEREFRLKYTRELQNIMSQGEVVMPGLAEQFLANDTAISKAFEEGAVSDPQKAMDDLLRPMITGMMNTELRRKMTGGSNEAPVIDSQEAFDKLPSGSFYRDSNGTLARKP